MWSRRCRSATAMLAIAAASWLPASVANAAEGTILRTNAQEQIVPHQDKTRFDAVSDAKRFDVIVALKSTYRPYVADMKRANPNLVLLVYVNASFAQDNEATAYPSTWYARSRAGAQIRSHGWGNYLMDVSHPGWIDNRASTCRDFISDSGYDGCFLDMLGTAPLIPGYLTAMPVNPHTGNVWTKREWLAATGGIARAVRELVAPRPVYGNGLGNGSLYFDPTAPSKTLLTSLDGGLAEAWMRSAKQDIRSFPSVAAWERNVAMVANAEAAGGSADVLVKVWVSGTTTEKNRWHRFALTSFLLGTGGRSSFSFSYGPTYESVPLESLWRVPLGDALGARYFTQRVYRRNFDNGVVLVNPGDRAHRVRLWGTFETLRGDLRTSVRIRPHTGRILLRT